MQSLYLSKGLGAEKYSGEDLNDPLYHKSIKELDSINNRYNATKTKILTLREEMDMLSDNTNRYLKTKMTDLRLSHTDE